MINKAMYVQSQKISKIRKTKWQTGNKIENLIKHKKHFKTAMAFSNLDSNAYKAKCM